MSTRVYLTLAAGSARPFLMKLPGRVHFLSVTSETDYAKIKVAKVTSTAVSK